MTENSTSIAEYFLMLSILVGLLLYATTLIDNGETFQTSKTPSHMASTQVNEPTVFNISGTMIQYSPTLSSSLGLNKQAGDNQITVSDGMPVERIKEICEHELLHEKGIGEEHHRYIYKQSASINSETCIRFIYELGYFQGANK